MVGNLKLKLIKAYLNLLDKLDWYKSLSQKSKIIYRNEVKNPQCILLIALFEKGRIRSDVVSLLEMAKKLNFYVVGVNTLRLNPGFNLQNMFDLYIERSNYGRDFGSYQDGCLYLLENKIVSDATQRLIILNDSVFYEKSRVEKFLIDLSQNEQEVLGATENSEIQYHIGSFCISVSGEIARSKKFFDYWKKYKNSNIRPKVIENGEMGLSKCLLSCASSQEKIDVLYNGRKLRKFLENEDNLANVIQSCRVSDRVGWPRFDLLGHFMDWLKHYTTFGLYERLEGGKSSNDLGGELYEELRFQNIHSWSSIKQLFSSLGFNEQSLNHYKESVISYLISISIKGSQIHQNTMWYLHMGMPIIKLDALYRGMLNEQDVLALKRYMSADQYDELEKLLFSKPFGGEFLFGWKRIAFHHGLI